MRSENAITGKADTTCKLCGEAVAMPRTDSHTLTLRLANLLSAQSIDTKTVEQALALLCSTYSFACGVVYEPDPTNKFCRKEQYGACKQSPPSGLPEFLSVKQLPLPDQNHWAKTGICYVQRGSANTKCETRLLELFNLHNIVLVPVTDETEHLYGFIVLGNTSAELCCKGQTDELFAMLSLLMHYVSGRMYQKSILQGRATLDNLLDSTGIDIYVNDFETHEILYINKSMAAPYGGKEVFAGKKCWQVLFPGKTGPCDFCPEKHLLDEDGRPARIYSWDYRRAFDGSWFRVFSGAFYWEDGRLAHIVSSADITENKRNEALVENLANYDQLTNLPNRRMLVRECEQRIENTKLGETHYVLFFDIDDFKKINDTLGHDAGDEFLVCLGEFFSSIPLLKNAIYRNGGDEFVAVMGGGFLTQANITCLVHFIHERFKKPWKLRNGIVYSNVSVGAACYPEDGQTVEALLQSADQAMYQVKKSGGGGLAFAKHSV